MTSIDFFELKSFLDEKALQYNSQDFIETDPIQTPKDFQKKEDIEISAFLVSVIAWGQRKSIINNAKKMMNFMGNSPYDFVISHSEDDLKKLENFVHRTFNGADFIQFIKSLKQIYLHYESLENAFASQIENDNLQLGISNFKTIFFDENSLQRTHKHLPDPRKGSAGKRINMFLRWMVRKDSQGVDFGIWNKIKPSQLSCPLDVHTGNVARKLGLISRKQNDAKALRELDTWLRKFDPADPVKYDFALFGLGAFENF